jgi:cyclopropane-fatty-acyl-phospholipid synthase
MTLSDLSKPFRPTNADIATLKGVPASFKAVCFSCQNLREGSLTMRLPNGRAFCFGGQESGPDAQMTVKDFAFARRVLNAGDIGFCEGYMADEWDTPDLTALLSLMSINIERVLRFLKGGPISQMLNMLRHFGRENTREGSRKNILAHYDLGNRFYQAWLDRTMTYSSARFDRASEDLEKAQLNKYRAMAHYAGLEPGDRVLEIGCGWGGFAEVAAKEFGAHVTGLTLSKEQHAFASARLQRQGLSEMSDIRIQDYRDVTGPFDTVVSIEMFEAVGEKYWPAYFSKVADVLKPGGRAALQIITIRDDLFEGYRKRADFIQRYVFPGGMLPSEQRLNEEIGRVGLSWRETHRFGQSYAETLRRWGEQFRAAWGDISPLGFDDRFKRLWQFYLSYCEAGFRTERTDVVQIALQKS